MKGDIAFILGWSMLYYGYNEEAVVHLKEAEQLFRTVGHREKITAVLGMLGGLSLSERNPDEALLLYQESEKLSKEFEDHLGEAASKFGIGFAFSMQGNNVMARKYFERASELYRMKGQKLDEFKSFVMLAQTFNDETETEKKIPILSEAVSMFSPAAMDAKEGLPVMSKLGTLYLRIGDKSKAEAVLDEGLRLALDKGELLFESVLANNLGGLVSAQGRTREAKRLFEQALSASKK